MRYVLAFEALSHRCPLGHITKSGQPGCAQSRVDACCSHSKIPCSHAKVDVCCCCGVLQGMSIKIWLDLSLLCSNQFLAYTLKHKIRLEHLGFAHVH